MKITIENKEYNLDIQRAITAGVLRERKNFTVSLTENEVAVLLAVLDRVGGAPEGPRGFANSASAKLRLLGGVSCEMPIRTDTKITCPNSIYLM